jgi:hypothetical protein
MWTKETDVDIHQKSKKGYVEYQYRHMQRRTIPAPLAQNVRVHERNIVIPETPE